MSELFPNDLILQTYIGLSGRGSFANDEARKSYLINVCKQPMFVSFDFSYFGLRNDDLDDIFNGLVEREAGNPQNSVLLLNLVSDEVTEEGIKSFLRKLQRGVVVNRKKVFPDVRNGVFRVGFPITDIFFTELLDIAPSVFAGSLKIVY